jgi:hypothetical protein
LQELTGATGLEPATSGVTGVTKRFSGLHLAAELAKKCGFDQVLEMFTDARLSSGFAGSFP